MSDFTIADVLAWARTKPADESYTYSDPGNCAICQFLRETGRAKTPRVIRDGWREDDSYNRTPYPDEIAEAANDGQRETTFGTFVARLKRLCPETVVTPSEWATIDAYLTDIDAVSADKQVAGALNKQSERDGA